MPRTARASVGGICYHVISRGNRRAEVFHCPGDYEAFEFLMERACSRLPMRVAGYCLMPNHFHLLLWPYNDGDLSSWMQWLLTSHVRRYHRVNGTDGRVWQGRFKAFPIQQDGHFLRVLRYCERNPLRANLVKDAEHWPWSSLSNKKFVLLNSRPLPLPSDWISYVNKPETIEELEALRNCANRCTPFGTKNWQETTADKLALRHTLRPRGRPRN